MHAARWVRRLDPSGRALGVGKRKTSVALVWLKEGSGGGSTGLVAGWSAAWLAAAAGGIQLAAVQVVLAH
jgi:hypothetical protein